MSMTWNSENRMTESISQNIYSGAKTLTRYKYDHEGNRVVKSSNYGEVVTPSAEISYRNDSIVTKHIFVSGVRVASKVSDEKSSNTYYQSVDHLGSTNILTDAKGEFYEHIETFPDGSIWVKEYVDQSGVNAVFTCHEMDVETKFFYAKARYYDAQLGRFISVDPIIGSYLPSGDKKRDKNMPGFGGFYNPVNINMYSYGANNPLKFVDPTGSYIIDKFNFIAKDSKWGIRFHSDSSRNTINFIKYLPSGSLLVDHITGINLFSDTYYDSENSKFGTGLSVSLGIIGGLPEFPVKVGIGLQFFDWFMTWRGNKSASKMDAKRKVFLKGAGLFSKKYLKHWNKKYLKSMMDLVDVDIFAYDTVVKGTDEDKGLADYAKNKSLLYKKVYLPKLEKRWAENYATKDPR